MRDLVDGMALVTDSTLLDGTRLAARTLGLLIEPSACLAAIAQDDLRGRALATGLTGVGPS